MESIGKTIRNELERQGRSVTWLARQLACHRTNVYDIFARDSLDLDLLIRISRVLQHNFLLPIAEELSTQLAAQLAADLGFSHRITIERSASRRSAAPAKTTVPPPSKEE